jgi:hypothetical protein
MVRGSGKANYLADLSDDIIAAVADSDLAVDELIDVFLEISLAVDRPEALETAPPGAASLKAQVEEAVFRLQFYDILRQRLEKVEKKLRELASESPPSRHLHVETRPESPEDFNCCSSNRMSEVIVMFADAA